MRRALARLALVAAVAVSLPVALPAGGPEPAPSRVSGPAGTAAVIAGHPLLLASLERIDRGSALWRRSIAS